MLSIASATEPSGVIVAVDGKNYYLHTVVRGDTLYSLSKCYNTTTQEIVAVNEGLTASTLKAGNKLLIPYRKLDDDSTQQSNKYRLHIVERGETLYSIARKYKIEVAILEEDNPDAVATQLDLGQELKIRRSAIGYTTTREIERERRNRDSNTKISVGANEHIVQAGETLYSLSRRFGLSEEDLLRINGLRNHREIKAGMTIKVALPIAVTEVTVVEQPSDTLQTEQHEIIDRDSAEAEEQTLMLGEEYVVDVQPVEVEFLPLSKHHTLKMALMLPFHVRDKVNPNYVDFYKGLLLAMEDIKAEGYSIELSVFDTRSNASHISDIVNFEAGLLDAQLIIGPVHENELRHVLSHAETNEIPVVTPLADIESLRSPVLFQMQAEEKYKYDKVADLFDNSREIITIYASNNDWDYAEEIKTLSKDVAVRRQLNFEFNRESFLYVRNADGSNGELVVIEDLMRSPTHKLFVVVASNETDVDRILTTLSSTKASLVGRSLSYGDYVVMGNRKWTNMKNIDRQSFFKNNVTFISPYYAKRNDEKVRIFDSRYVKAYGTLPSMFSYRGYDAAMIFCRKMYEGLDASFCEETLCPLSTGYRFRFEDGMYVNSEWIREQYRSNFTIEIE